MLRLLLLALAAGTLASGCGDSGRAGGFASAPSTTRPQSAEGPGTTISPVTVGPSTTRPTREAEAIVDRGTLPGGAWQLLAQSGPRPDTLCAELRGPFQIGGRVCNEASEQDFNGNDVLRYSVGGDGTFVIGVTRPNVAKVRMELRGAPTVERETVAASITTAGKFVALPLPAGAVIRSLAALDSRGAVVTTININP